MAAENKQNGTEETAAENLLEMSTLPGEKPEGLPKGKYALVGWDMDTTGRRLIDEICQIAAYSSKSKYSQYIMPYGNLNLGARRRHQICVVTVGRYRMLKDITQNKILKTKSEISALTDFIDWLEKERGDAKSVILIYHEPRRINPIMLLQALERYNLVDRFKQVVSGFADSYALAADKCKSTVKSVSLRVLSRVLLDTDTLSVDSALDRATCAYRIVEHLAQGDQQEANSGDMSETARLWARPVQTECDALVSFKELLERQNTLKPVFGPLLNASWPERHRLTALRRMLADAGLLYDTLKDAWVLHRKDGLAKKLQEVSISANEDDVKEIIEILDCHFDPLKEPKVTVKKPKSPRAYKNKKTTSTDDENGEANATNGNAEQSTAENNNEVPAESSQNNALPTAVAAK